MVIFASCGRVSYNLIIGLLARRQSPISLCNLKLLQKMPFYAVAKGVVPGIYTDWPTCQKQVQGFRGPQFKKFDTQEEAEEFIALRTGGVVDKRKAGVLSEKQDSESSKSNDGESTSKEKPAKKKKIDDGSGNTDTCLPPELLSLRQDLRRMQRELSQLHDRFDKYVAAVTGHEGKSEPEPQKSKGKKRALSSEEQEKEAAPYKGDSGIKKRVLAKPIPDKKLFQLDEDGNVVVYTDGCCEMNGRHGARAGIGVYFGEENPMNVSEPVRGRATNNTAEIQAITYALELIKRAGFDKAVINTDSQFVINCMTSWLSGWKKRGWKKSDGSEVINKEDLIDLDRASDGLMVKYNHVKGHSGLHGNERADQLAKEGAKSYDANATE
ncbi:ribonuclease H1 [Hyalella azteca]|uniref:Ribonuclease H n=1 Tax=Hyalella azteca TaxID=294128 RepID=A0A979FFI7_HYAAZ|nr:ribonuclease H1 [Hyalella azteca]